MEKLFKYQIENFATERHNIIETHVTIWEDGHSKSFYTGLYTNNRGYSSYCRGLFSTDVTEYGFNKSYNFKQKWIEIILYDAYVEKLVNPDSNLKIKTRDRIIDDIECLSSFKSYQYSLEAFLLDRFRNVDEDPEIQEYQRYHRLLDCLLDYQLRYKSLVTKESGDKQMFLEFVRYYSNGSEKFNLESEFLDFLSWARDSKLDLLTEDDVVLLSKLGL